MLTSCFVLYKNVDTKFHDEKVRGFFEYLPFSRAKILAEDDEVWVDYARYCGKVFGYKRGRVVKAVILTNSITLTYRLADEAKLESHQDIIPAGTRSSTLRWIRDIQGLMDYVENEPKAIYIGS